MWYTREANNYFSSFFLVDDIIFLIVCLVIIWVSVLKPAQPWRWSVRVVLVYAGTNPSPGILQKSIPARVSLISLTENFLPALLTFFSSILIINSERRQVRKCALILSSLCRKTGLASKSVFITLKNLCVASHKSFKWLKQHLKIKKFWGTTENAVPIQIYVAICTYCLVAIVQKDMKLDRSTYEVLQILSISLTDKTHLRDLFDKTKFQNVKDRFRLNEPNLFNY